MTELRHRDVNPLSKQFGTSPTEISTYLVVAVRSTELTRTDFTEISDYLFDVSRLQFHNLINN
jgi:hypothetical protein